LSVCCWQYFGNGGHGEVTSTAYRRPVDHTQRQALCTALWATGRNVQRRVDPSASSETRRLNACSSTTSWGCARLHIRHLPVRRRRRWWRHHTAAAAFIITRATDTTPGECDHSRYSLRCRSTSWRSPLPAPRPLPASERHAVQSTAIF